MTTEQVTPSHGTNKDTWADKVRIILSLAGLAYLTAIPFFSSMGKPGMPEAVVFATIVLLNPKVFANLAELSISSKGIGFKVQQVEKKQIDQADQIKALYWLIASVATDLELDYLERMAGNGPAQFDNGDEHAKALSFRVMDIESDPNAEGFYRKLGARRVGVNVSELDGQRHELSVLVYEIPTMLGDRVLFNPTFRTEI